MKTLKVKRTIKFKVTYDETKPDARKEAMDSLRHMMASRNWPIPFKVSSSGYEIERIW